MDINQHYAFVGFLVSDSVKKFYALVMSFILRVVSELGILYSYVKLQLDNHRLVS